VADKWQEMAREISLRASSPKGVSISQEIARTLEKVALEARIEALESVRSHPVREFADWPVFIGRELVAARAQLAELEKQL
jgi:hypothetical protein